VTIFRADLMLAQASSNVSKQTDVIIFNALNCPTYQASESAAIYPANNVAAVIEVKSKLDTRELEDAFNKIAGYLSRSLERTVMNWPAFRTGRLSIGKD